jgi:hypothetical protein
MTRWFLGISAALAVAVWFAGFKWRRARRAAVGIAAVAGAIWLAAWLSRPAWLRHALDARERTNLSVAWTERAPGLETGELTVSAGRDGELIDRVALVRLDPARWVVSVHHGAPRTAEDWQRSLGAVVVENGGYFRPDGSPATPIRAGGVAEGPSPYDSRHGALVSSAGAATIVDLAGGADAATAIAAYQDAIVSYPILVDESGAVRAAAHPDWLANRSFVAVDRAGRVVLGTTRTGYFSLRRLGEVLRDAPLDLRLALNLDGGPIASQVVDAGGYRRVVHGSAETTSGADVVRLLYQRFLRRDWELPIVVAVTAR